MNKEQIRKQIINKFLPKSWRTIRLGEIVDFINGKAHENFIVKEGQFTLINSKFISSNGTVIKKTNKQKSPLFKNNIVMVMSDVPNGRALAKCFLVNEDNKYTLNQRICALRIKDKVDPIYLFYTLNRNSYYIRFDNGVGQTNLRKDEVLSCQLSMPSFLEQKRIVDILSTWDQAIEKLEKLISAKEKQFKWLLKKLIYDQKNNPNWEKVKLEKILNYEQPTNYIVHSTKYNDQHNTSVLTAGKTFIIGYTNEKYGVFPINKLPVIIFDDFTTAKQFVNFPFKVKSSAMKILLPEKETVDIKFVFYSMKNITFQVKSHKRFWISQYSKFRIPIPSFSEQKKITEILSKWEKEIENLKQLSKKYCQQKKGLMQQLLTGKIRLQ